jgi:tol-pal system protein YbgF
MTSFAFRVFFKILLASALVCAVDGALTRVDAQDADTVVRLEQLEHQMRELTGTIEQLQYRNQQLEQALHRMQEDMDFRLQQSNGKGAPTVTQGRPATTGPTTGTTQSTAPTNAPTTTPQTNGRRSDAFDPTINPNASGAPRTLGTLATNSAGTPTTSADTGVSSNGGPLDLSNGRGGPVASSGDVAANGTLSTPPARNTNATGGQLTAVLPPSQSPRDEYDLAYGYLLRKDYASAEQSFSTFLRTYPNDRMAADAQFWMGESMFQRQSYRDAADAFLTVTKKYESSAKAPDALLRLGQSLAAIGEKDLACATFTEVGRKYPRASPNVKQGVDREQKRVHC